jgi:hypothetical protein
MFDENKKHGFVVVEYTGESYTNFTKGGMYEGIIDITNRAVVLNNNDEWSIVDQKYYKIIHDLRVPVKIGEEAEFSDCGDRWCKGVFAGAFLSGENQIYRNKDNFAWKNIRAIQKPNIKITVEINGKEANLSDISEETLIKLRNENKKPEPLQLAGRTERA